MKKLAYVITLAVMVLALNTAVFAKSFEVCITMNTNEQLDITNTYVGNGMWSLSGWYIVSPGGNPTWPVSGTADAYADTIYAKLTNTNQNNCNFTYDYLVWRAFQTPGSFNGNVEQWCYCCGESPGNVVWVSCKVNLGSCDNVKKGCGHSPDQGEHRSPIEKGYVQSSDEAQATDQGLATYFDLLRANMMNISVAPNPSTSIANFSYTTTSTGLVTVTVYNSLGQMVKMLVNNSQAEGSYTINWDLTDQKGAVVPKGNYFVRIQSDKDAQTQAFAVDR